MAGALWLWLLPGLLGAQGEVPPERLLLARIRLKMTENLNKLPNYTCVQTIERSARRRASGRYELLDVLRLEVALVGGKEMFAWPGGAGFEERELSEYGGGVGAIGNGSFGLHARAVFVSSAPTFQYVGESERDGRTLVRYDYRVPQALSGYQIRMGETKAIVGYHGSFWADKETLDLVRLEVEADDIPPHLQIAEAVDAMEYARVRIGESDFLLPRSSELRMVELGGAENRNRTRFTSCRQYTGESVLSFGDPPPSVEMQAPAVETIELPPGLLLDVRLDTEIEAGQTAVGDPVTGVVERDARKSGRVVVPKGARLEGRFTRLERRRGRVDYCIVGVLFHQIAFGSARAAFPARLENVGPFLSGGARLSLEILGESRRPQQPGSGVFYIRGSPSRVMRGLRMQWRIEPLANQEGK